MIAVNFRITNIEIDFAQTKENFSSLQALTPCSFSVMFQFNTLVASLPSVPQGTVLIWDRELISFLKKNQTFKTKHEEINHLKELCIHIDIILGWETQMKTTFIVQ